MNPLRCLFYASILTFAEGSEIKNQMRKDRSWDPVWDRYCYFDFDCGWGTKCVRYESNVIGRCARYAPGYIRCHNDSECPYHTECDNLSCHVTCKKHYDCDWRELCLTNICIPILR